MSIAKLISSVETYLETLSPHEQIKARQLIAEAAASRSCYPAFESVKSNNNIHEMSTASLQHEDQEEGNTLHPQVRRTEKQIISKRMSKTDPIDQQLMTTLSHTIPDGQYYNNDKGSLGVGNTTVTENGTTIKKNKEMVWNCDESLPTIILPKKKTRKSTPKRKNSAYAVFFRIERQRIVDACYRGEIHDTLDEYGSNYPVEPYTAESIKAYYDEQLSIPNNKRKHRKTHGTISFLCLASVISRRWQTISEVERNLFDRISCLESQNQRYQAKNEEKLLENEWKAAKKDLYVVSPNISFERHDDVPLDSTRTSAMTNGMSGGGIGSMMDDNGCLLVEMNRGRVQPRSDDSHIITQPPCQHTTIPSSLSQVHCCNKKKKSTSSKIPSIFPTLNQNQFELSGFARNNAFFLNKSTQQPYNNNFSLMASPLLGTIDPLFSIDEQQQLSSSSCSSSSDNDDLQHEEIDDLFQYNSQCTSSLLQQQVLEVGTKLKKVQMLRQKIAQNEQSLLLQQNDMFHRKHQLVHSPVPTGSSSYHYPHHHHDDNHYNNTTAISDEMMYDPYCYINNNSPMVVAAATTTTTIPSLAHSNCYPILWDSLYLEQQQQQQHQQQDDDADIVGNCGLSFCINPSNDCHNYFIGGHHKNNSIVEHDGRQRRRQHSYQDHCNNNGLEGYCNDRINRNNYSDIMEVYNRTAQVVATNCQDVALLLDDYNDNHDTFSHLS